MKKVTICLIAFIVSIVSCKKDPLNITPDGRISIADVFKDNLKTEAYLNTVYSSRPNYFYHYQYYSFLSALTDETMDVQVGVEGTNLAGQWQGGGMTASNNLFTSTSSGAINVDHYSAFWVGIRNANVFLANIDNSAVAPATNKSRFKAEAQVLRAFYYFELIKQFGPMPVVDKPFDAAFDYTTLVRPAFQNDIDFIVKDCDAAIANPDLPMRISIEAERGRFTKAVAYAIKSEALLYNASPLWNPTNDQSKWQTASAASNNALSVLTGGGQFVLATNYGDYFLKTSDMGISPVDKETIYEINAGGQPEFVQMFAIPSKVNGTKAGTTPTQELVDSYEMKATGEPPVTGYSDADHLLPIFNPASGYNEANPYVGRDLRFSATVWYNGASYDNVLGAVHTMQTFVGGADGLNTAIQNKNTRNGYYLRKFVDPKIQTGVNSSARWKKYRLAEIYLNYAEAENEVSGPSIAVYSAINTIRTRAQMPNLPLGLNQAEMRKRIRAERRIELAIEEHRFWDVRRWKILGQTDQVTTGMKIIKQTGGTFTYQRFVAERRGNGWQDKYLIFPIPQIDASIIPDFTNHQNPGW